MSSIEEFRRNTAFMKCFAKNEESKLWEDKIVQLQAQLRDERKIASKKLFEKEMEFNQFKEDAIKKQFQIRKKNTLQMHQACQIITKSCELLEKKIKLDQLKFKKIKEQFDKCEARFVEYETNCMAEIKKSFTEKEIELVKQVIKKQNAKIFKQDQLSTQKLENVFSCESTLTQLPMINLAPSQNSIGDSPKILKDKREIAAVKSTANRPMKQNVLTEKQGNESFKPSPDLSSFEYTESGFPPQKKLTTFIEKLDDSINESQHFISPKASVSKALTKQNEDLAKKKHYSFAKADLQGKFKTQINSFDSENENKQFEMSKKLNISTNTEAINATVNVTEDSDDQWNQIDNFQISTQEHDFQFDFNQLINPGSGKDDADDTGDRDSKNGFELNLFEGAEDEAAFEIKF